MVKQNNDLIRKPKLPLGWVRRMIEQTHTQQEWVEMIRGLPDQVQVQFLLATQPKEMKVESDTTISLIINGVRQVNAIDGHTSKALPVHDGDYDDTA
jgi:hypothetical protein